MATTIRRPDRPPQVFTEAAAEPARGQPYRAGGRMGRPGPDWRFARGGTRLMTWAALALALLSFTAFAYQAFYVPQPRDYAPNWHGAQWITAGGTHQAVVYFRENVTLQGAPTGAFIVAQGAQTYNLYVNGQLIDKTQDEYTMGAVNLAHIYDVGTFLREGVNTVALRVEHDDDGVPALRAALGINLGGQQVYFPSGASWRTTDQPAFTQPYASADGPNWTSPDFSDTPWEMAARYSGPAILDGVLHINPQLYETPLPTRWITAGPTHDAFFAGGATLAGARDVWLRVASNGVADVYLNGRRVAIHPLRSTGPVLQPVPGHVIVTAGMYDVTPYLHDGRNSVAVHVTAINTQAAALGLDLVADTGAARPLVIATGGSWTASSVAAPDWTDGAGAAAKWPTAEQVDYSVVSRDAAYRLPLNADQIAGPRSSPVGNVITFLTTTDFPYALFAALIFALACAAAVALLLVRQRGVGGVGRALDRLALAFLPALALMLLLLTLSVEPLMPRPFPFTPLWFSVLVASVAVMVALLAFLPARSVRGEWSASAGLRAGAARTLRLGRWRFSAGQIVTALVVAALTLLGLYMVTYQLGYETYWQDELTSIYAAEGVLQRGYPNLLSGFIYPKAELFHYMLAPILGIFGSGPLAGRALSAVEYVVMLPLVYLIARYFVGRRAALIALAVVVFSPIALRWGREARMYEQAELTALLVVYLFYRAMLPAVRTRDIYLAMGAIVVMYLSHEETFIFLPAILLYFVAHVLHELVRNRRLAYLSNIHWWAAALPAIAIIAVQLYAVKATHPPILGTDRTEQPLIAFSGRNVPYYLELLFFSGATSPNITYEMGILSTLSLAAALAGVLKPEPVLRYLGVFLFVPLVTLTLTFSLTSDRYLVPMVPLFAMLAAASIDRALLRLAAFARPRAHPLVARALVASAGTLLVAMLLFSQLAGVANFGLAASRTLNIPHQHYYVEYQSAGDYILSHWQDGDVIIGLAPDLEGAYYAKSPAYFLYQNKALYLFERDSHIIDTPIGSQALLNSDDVNAVLAKHHRIWIFSSRSYQTFGRNYPILQNFVLVYEGQGTFVYFREG